MTPRDAARAFVDALRLESWSSLERLASRRARRALGRWLGAALEGGGGHPRGFYVLAALEFWERWSFYLMKFLAVLYMVERLGMPEAQATAWLGLYVGAVYLTPLPGGLLGDLKLGPMRAAVAGAAVMLAGHSVMAVESRPALVCAMALLAVGGGLFKPNVQALVRGLYREGDARLDGAYKWFYVAINLGALTSPLAGNLLRRRFGWGVAFASAAAGLAVGLALLLAFRRHVTDVRTPITGATGVPLEPDAARGHVHDRPRDAARRIAAVAVATAAGVVYWTVAYMDAGTLTLWARACVRGAAESPELYGMVNPAVVFVATPLLLVALAWLKARRGGRPLGTAAQLTAGLGLTGAACLVLSLGARGSATGVSGLWLASYYVLVTLGELLVQPVSVAFAAQVAPPRLPSFTLGVALLSSAAAGPLGGALASRYWERVSHGTYFAANAALALAAAAALLLLRRPLGRLLATGAP